MLYCNTSLMLRTSAARKVSFESSLNAVFGAVHQREWRRKLNSNLSPICCQTAVGSGGSQYTALQTSLPGTLYAALVCSVLWQSATEHLLGSPGTVRTKIEISILWSHNEDFSLNWVFNENSNSNVQMCLQASCAFQREAVGNPYSLNFRTPLK